MPNTTLITYKGNLLEQMQPNSILQISVRDRQPDDNIYVENLSPSFTEISYDGNTIASLLGESKVSLDIKGKRGNNNIIIKNELKLRVSVSISGPGTVSGSGEYLYGQTVTITTSYETSHIAFDGWYDGNILVSSSPSYSFIITKDVSLTARTREIGYLVSSSVEPGYLADVPVFEGLGRYTAGKEVTITCTVYGTNYYLSRLRFVKSSTDFFDINSPYTFTMPATPVTILAFIGQN